jgi:hypothetical protein
MVVQAVVVVAQIVDRTNGLYIEKHSTLAFT